MVTRKSKSIETHKRILAHRLCLWTSVNVHAAPPLRHGILSASAIGGKLSIASLPNEIMLVFFIVVELYVVLFRPLLMYCVLRFSMFDVRVKCWNEFRTTTSKCWERLYGNCSKRKASFPYSADMKTELEIERKAKNRLEMNKTMGRWMLTKNIVRIMAAIYEREKKTKLYNEIIIMIWIHSDFLWAILSRLVFVRLFISCMQSILIK